MIVPDQSPTGRLLQPIRLLREYLLLFRSPPARGDERGLKAPTIWVTTTVHLFPSTRSNMATTRRLHCPRTAPLRYTQPHLHRSVRRAALVPPTGYTTRMPLWVKSGSASPRANRLAMSRKDESWRPRAMLS